MPTYPGSPTLTVAMMLKQPRVLSRNLTSLVSKRYAADELFARGTPEMVAGGSAVYQKSESIFPDKDIEEVGVRAEFPRTGWSEALYTAVVHKYGLEIPIAYESIRRNAMDQVVRAQRKLANALVRFVDTLAMTLLTTDADVLTDTASADWTTANTDIIGDIATAKKLIYDLNEGYDPDTMVVNPAQELDLLLDADIRSAMPRETAASAVQTGRAPVILGISKLIVTPQLTAGTVVILESKTVGTIADESPDAGEGYVSYSPGAGFAPVYVKVYDETKRDERVIRCARFPAMWLSEPKAAIVVTGA
jgi:hypothetical protein